MTPPRTEEYDVVVIGCGPAGCITATELARRGVSVLAIERQRFPRYRVGESLTVSAGNIVREYGLEAEMERLDFPVKTGVKVIGGSARSEFYVPVAKPTWQVRRAEFDQLLLEYAVKAGAEHRWGSVKEVLQEGRTVVGVAYRPEGSEELVQVRAKVVVDASGHGAMLSTHHIAGRRMVEAFGRQIALFTQFEHATRDPGAMGDNTFIFYGSKHHWGWFIPLSSTATSVGIVLPTTTYKGVGGDPDAVLAWGLENVNPDLHRRVADLTPTEPVRVVRNYSYRIDPFVGDGWLCVGDSHRFADPIFSFGVSFAMTEGQAAARAIVEALQTGDCAQPFADFADFSDRGNTAAVDLIRYFWRFPAFFQFQTRGRTRDDMIRLLGGDCFTDDPIEVLEMMRRSMSEISVTQISEARAQEISRQIYARYSDFQGIDASYIGVDEDGIEVSFLLAEEDESLMAQVCEFERSLYDEFGREDLAVLSLGPEAVASLPEQEGHPFRGESAITIFDRRAA